MCIDSYADISIHTPTRGTTAGTGTATNLAEFQSTFPREERPYYTIVRIQVLQFQSTLPREERPFPTDFVTAFMPYFNPRSHERSDFTGDYTFEVTLISIHAPTRGATIIFQMSLSRTLFQSTLPREERLWHQTRPAWWLYFNPRSHERSDTDEWLYDEEYLNFNPRSHERSDFIGLLNYNRLILFQSTLPREERPFSFKEFFSIFYFNPRSHERSDSTALRHS